MTPKEFKAWFEGFTEAFDRLPTKAQWARVKERVAEIDGSPITERHFIDRYLPSYPISPLYHWNTAPSHWPIITCGATSSGVGTSSNNCASATSDTVMLTFNSCSAMSDLGRAEAQSLVS